MPWPVTFSYLTVPFVIGAVSTRIAVATDPQYDLFRGGLVVLIWYLLAVRLHQHLRKGRPKTWAWWWAGVLVVLPLGFGFVAGPARPVAEVIRAPLGTTPPTATPTADTPPPPLTWRTAWDFVARVQPRLVAYLVQLFLTLPVAWWFVAVVIALTVRNR